MAVISKAAYVAKTENKARKGDEVNKIRDDDSIRENGKVGKKL